MNLDMILECFMLKNSRNYSLGPYKKILIKLEGKTDNLC